MDLRLLTCTAAAIALTSGLNWPAAASHGFLDTGGVFTTIDPPGTTDSIAWGINNSGQIAGQYYDGGWHGYLDSSGVFTPIDVPGSTATLARGISNSGAIDGIYYSAGGAQLGFVQTGGALATIPLPVVPASIYRFSAKGINNAGQIVGGFDSDRTPPGSPGYVYTAGAYSLIDFPSAYSTQASGINDAGQIVGSYTDHSNVRTHGFLDNSGVLISLDVPGAYSTFPEAINNLGEIAGYYFKSPGAAPQGFIDIDGVFTTIDAPGSGDTRVFGINDSGQLVGDYTLGPVPEPASLALLGVGITGLVAARRVKRYSAVGTAKLS